MKIELIFKCKCNYLTVKFINGAWNTLTIKTFKTNIGNLPENIQNTYSCNNCINNWNVENKQYTLFKLKPSVIWQR